MDRLNQNIIDTNTICISLLFAAAFSFLGEAAFATEIPKQFIKKRKQEASEWTYTPKLPFDRIAPTARNQKGEDPRDEIEKDLLTEKSRTIAAQDRRIASRKTTARVERNPRSSIPGLEYLATEGLEILQSDGERYIALSGKLPPTSLSNQSGPWSLEFNGDPVELNGGVEFVIRIPLSSELNEFTLIAEDRSGKKLIEKGVVITPPLSPSQTLESKE